MVLLSVCPLSYLDDGSQAHLLQPGEVRQIGTIERIKRLFVTIGIMHDQCVLEVTGISPRDGRSREVIGAAARLALSHLLGTAVAESATFVFEVSVAVAVAV